jgi:hypothetical protein
MSSYLRTNLIKLAYEYPHTRKDILPLIRVAEDSDAKSKPKSTVPTKEELYQREFRNPDTGRKVLLKTLLNAPPGSAARREGEIILEQWESAVRKEQEETKKDSPQDEDKEDAKDKEEKGGEDDGAKEKMLEVAEKSRGKIQGAIEASKNQIRKSVKKFFSHDASFGDLVDASMTLVHSFFDDREGQKLMNDLLTSLGMKTNPSNEQRFKEGLAALKASEIAGSLDPEIRKNLIKTLGLDPENQDVNKEVLKKWFQPDGDDDNKTPDEVMKEIFAFFLPVTDVHLELLRLFIKDGELDVKKLREQLGSGIPEKMRDAYNQRMLDIEKAKKVQESKDEEPDAKPAGEKGTKSSPEKPKDSAPSGGVQPKPNKAAPKPKDKTDKEEKKHIPEKAKIIVEKYPSMSDEHLGELKDYALGALETKKMSPDAVKKKFLSKASPETREKVEKMDTETFQKLLRALRQKKSSTLVLRSSLIRLSYTNPSFRRFVLPLIK